MSRMCNTTLHTQGRFGNQFIRNMCFHILAKKYNISFTFSHYDDMKEMGINLFVEGQNKYSEIKKLVITDDNFMDYIEGNNTITENLSPSPAMFAQTKQFALYLRKYFENNGLFRSVILSNKFKKRYVINNDLYVHVRIGDVPQFTPPLEYFSSAISKFSYTTGFISSDTIDSELCKDLIKKYNLVPIDLNEKDTILFASTCKYLVLSQGTFSWLIGFLGIYSTICYPKIKKIWHGDIFVFSDWNEIDFTEVYIDDTKPEIKLEAKDIVVENKTCSDIKIVNRRPIIKYIIGGKVVTK